MNKIIMTILVFFLAGCLEKGDSSSDLSSQPPSTPSGDTRVGAPPCDRCGVGWSSWTTVSSISSLLSASGNDDILLFDGVDSSAVTILQKSYVPATSDFVQYLEIVFDKDTQTQTVVSQAFSSSNAISITFKRNGNNINYTVANKLDSVMQPPVVNEQVIITDVTHITDPNYKTMLIFSRTSGVTRVSVDYNLTDFSDPQYQTSALSTLNLSGQGKLNLRTF